MLIIYLLSYLSILLFIFFVVSKIRKYATAPVHIRWELYPVAHEGKKSKYGGSYYEEVDWWTKKREVYRVAEIIAMMEEIILLKGVYKHNKKLWLLSFPFHLGLYLVTTTLFLLILSAILDITNIVALTETGSGLGSVIHYLTLATGYSGLLLTFIGAAGLLVQRLTDEKFRFYNTPMDILNLVFILILVVSVAITLLYSNESFAASGAFVKNLLTFNIAEISDPYFAAHIILIALFLVYFPMTRMMHLFAKYFTYHDVRWQDEPNVKGSKLEAKIKEALNFGVSWSAPHMKTGKTWAEVATTFPEEVKK